MQVRLRSSFMYLVASNATVKTKFKLYTYE
jgi:hypothetical protein